MPYTHIYAPRMPTAFSGVQVRAGLYLVVTSRCRGSTGVAFTLSAWVYGNPASQGANGGIIARGYGNGGEQYCMDMDSGHFRFYVRNASDTATVINSSIAPNGAWQHVCAVYSASSGVMNLYINGVLAGSATPPSSLLVTNHDLSIGARQSANYDGAPYDDDWVDRKSTRLNS